MAVIFVLEFMVVLISSSSAQPGALRVYKGELDLRNDFPFAVLLQMAESPFIRMCTGSLISKNWVLTAAHCIQDFPLVVKYGEFTQNTTASKSYTRILKTYIHPGFKFNQGMVCSNDIGLILVEKVPNKKQAKLLALDYKSLFGLPVKYAGLGRISRSVRPLKLIKLLRNQLLPVKVGQGVVVSCEKTTITYKYGPVVCIAPNCSNKLQQARPGDSGGPLIYNGILIGVAASIHHRLPITFYTPVSPYLPWIAEVFQSHKKLSK